MCVYADIAAGLRYEPATGVFFDRAGTLVGHSHSKWYIAIGSGMKKVLAHRLAWYMAHGEIPSVQIDHINRNKTDNRISNLRLATNFQNHKNMPKQKNNTSGVVGVALDRHGKKWQAYIKHMGKRIHLGIYESFFDAVCARKSAEKHFLGEFAPI